MFVSNLFGTNSSSEEQFHPYVGDLRLVSRGELLGERRGSVLDPFWKRPDVVMSSTMSSSSSSSSSLMSDLLPPPPHMRLGVLMALLSIRDFDLGLMRGLGECERQYRDDTLSLSLSSSKTDSCFLFIRGWVVVVVVGPPCPCCCGVVGGGGRGDADVRGAKVSSTSSTIDWKLSGKAGLGLLHREPWCSTPYSSMVGPFVAA